MLSVIYVRIHFENNIARDLTGPNLCDFLLDYWMFDSSLIFGLQSVLAFRLRKGQ